MGCSSGPDIIQDGLVLCLDAASIRSYPKSGTTWSDLKGNADGTLVNMSNPFTSDGSGGILFDGTDDSVTLSDLNSNLFDGEASLFCFLKTYTSGPNSGGKSGIFGFGDSSTGGYSNSHYTWSDGKIYLDTFRPSRVNSITPSSIDRSKPHALCITTKEGGQWKLYQNLELVTSTAATYISINSSRKRIGWDDSISYIFSGTFYNFMIYNKELSFEEIRQNYLSTKERFA